MSRKAWFGSVGFNVLGLALSVLALVLSGILSDWNWMLVVVATALAVLFAWFMLPENKKRGTKAKRANGCALPSSGVMLRVHRSPALTSTGPTTWSMVMRRMRPSRTSSSG